MKAVDHVFSVSDYVALPVHLLRQVYKSRVFRRVFDGLNYMEPTVVVFGCTGAVLTGSA